MVERAGEEAPMPDDIPTPFVRRRTVTFQEGTTSAAARNEESSSGQEERLLQDHQRAALAATVEAGPRPHLGELGGG